MAIQEMERELQNTATMAYDEQEAIREAEHNAMISERYNRLQNTVYEQLSEVKTEEPVRASTIAPERTSFNVFSYASVLEQAPAVTEFVRYEEPVIEREIVAPVETPVMEATPVREEYALNSVAKLALAAFATVVVGLCSLISVNTGIINSKKLQLQTLQARKQELVETNQEIQRRIDNARSEETIREYAQSQGYID